MRGIAAATAWVTEQFKAIAVTSNGNMTVQQQSFVQYRVPASVAFSPGTRSRG